MDINKKWTYGEDEIIKSNYYELGATGIQKLLPNRTITSIRKRASTLKIKNHRRRDDWTEEEIEILREYYPYEGTLVIERLNNRSKNSILNKANRLGIKVERDNEPWELKEDELACDFYFKYKAESMKKIDELIEVFIEAGFDKRTKSSLSMKLANYSYLDTGYGLSHPSKKSKNIYYNKLSLLIKKIIMYNYIPIIGKKHNR